jgi:hypothetical protein
MSLTPVSTENGYTGITHPEPLVPQVSICQRRRSMPEEKRVIDYELIKRVIEESNLSTMDLIPSSKSAHHLSP